MRSVVSYKVLEKCAILITYLTIFSQNYLKYPFSEYSSLAKYLPKTINPNIFQIT